MGVQGFPTLKIVRPGKTTGKPIVEDYQGARTAKDIADAVVGKIKNHVSRLQDEDVDEWLKLDNGTAKAILFAEKPTVSALLKSLAIDFLGSVKFAQIRRHQKKSMDMFGIEDWPKLLFLPGGDQKGVLYDGLMNKDAMLEFLSKYVTPNPDPAPAKAKSKSRTKDSKSKSKDSSSFSKASESHKSSEASEAAASATAETVESDDPLPSPEPHDDTQKPIQVDTPPPPELKTLDTFEELQDRCLTKQSAICFLAVLPKKETPEAMVPSSAVLALRSLSEIAQKHQERSGKAALRIYAVSDENKLGKLIRSKAEGEVEILALNGKRQWIKRYTDESLDQLHVETWVDMVRMGEGRKENLPEEVEAAVLSAPANPIVDSVPADQPIAINLEDLMSGKMGEDSPLKVEVVEELNDHDEL